MRFLPSLIMLLMVGVAQTAAQEPDEPLDVGQVEQVEVRLVLLDVLALDRRDRTVPGLTLDQFQLYVDSNPVEIDSLDVYCPLGKVSDPRAGQTVEVPSPAQTGAPLRIVHAFDYYHMGEFVAGTIESAREAIARLSTGNEEQMVVTIGTGLRIQSPFTSDPARIDATLQRMYEDPVLYGGFYGRLTERPFYRRLLSLIDFLERIDGAKIVVLYSGPFHPDGFHHDPEFRRISAMAATARVALYPVDSGGMRTPKGFRYGDLGGPKELARLAVETGGRVTYHTNDLGLALARAQRDYGCRYTLGFYDGQPRLDEVRRVSITIDKRGVRAVHPAHYVLRSDPKQLDSQIRTAGMVPEMYDDGEMSAVALGLRPRTRQRWEVAVAVDLPRLADSSPAPGPWVLRGRVMTPSGSAVRRFERRWSPADEAEVLGSGGSRTVVERVGLRPGSYRVSIVLSREGMSVPWATQADIDLSPVPVGETFLVGPHLGRFDPVDRSLDGAADSPQGPEWRFEPLVVPTVERGGVVELQSWVCSVGRRDVVPSVVVGRQLFDGAGRKVGGLDDVFVELDPTDELGCQPIVDVLPTTGLATGSYSIRALLDGKDAGTRAVFRLSD
jgi:VWFA-related protein